MDGEFTDEELRAELTKFGQNPGPITVTTRKVWLKRLKNLKEGAVKPDAKAQAVPSRKLVGLSSDESERDDAEAGGSTTISGPKKKSNTPRRSRSAKLSVNSNTPADHGSPHSSKSLPAFIKPSPKPQVRAVNVPVKVSPKKGKNSQNANVPSTSKIPQIHLADYSESDGNSSAEEPMEMDDANGHASPHFEPVLPRLRRNNTTIPSYLQSTVTGRRSLSDIRASGYVEIASSNESLINDNFLSTSPRSMMSMGINTSPSLDFSSTGNSSLDSLRGGLSYNSGDSLLSNEKKDSSQNHKDGENHGFRTKEDETSYSYPHYISWGLILAVLVIFGIIAGIYLANLSVHTNENTANQNAALSATDVCVYSLLDYLSNVAGEAICQSVPVSGRVNVINARSNTNGSSSNKTWNDCLTAIIDKPELGVSLLSADDVIAQRAADVTWLESSRPNMPFSCRLLRSVYNIVFFSLFILAALGVVALVVAIVRYIKRRREDSRRQFYDLVEEIMDTLQQHVTTCLHNPELKPYLAIAHIRDMLIPPGERKSKKKLWDSVVTFLEANESRVRTESQVIMGEEFLVWRWLPTVKDNNAPGCSPGGRVWQGQACSDPGGNSVKAQYSPTACLKVRNMFDACVEFGEDWPVNIQDAILEKCMTTCPRAILHLAVDKNSKEGCVYIKCVSRDMAGHVYKALHGWWFDGKLVTVKYLRPERYLERFPESAMFSHPLSPSNSNMLSMAPQPLQL